MRSKDETKFKTITDEIKRFMIAKGRTPSQRELSSCVGLGRTAVCRYLKTMKEKGIIEGIGRELTTKEIQLIPVPIVDSLYNSNHIYDDAKLDDYIFISRKIYGEGEFGIVRAVDDSMSKCNINPNNFIIIRRQKIADIGQIVLVKSNGKYYLRRLNFDYKKRETMLSSESNSQYEKIVEFEIRGVVISVIVHFDMDIVEKYIHHLIL